MQVTFRPLPTWPYPATPDHRRRSRSTFKASWANARAMSHPGVELSFDSRFGRLTYATDAHELWQHNVRAIALSLQALRAVDRYGVSKRGEQYAGWAQLAAGGPDPARGKALVDQAGGMVEALKRHHPDHGGQDRDFVDVQAYRQQLAGS